MFEALEKAYEHAKSFDAYFGELCTNKELKYNSPYLDMITETREKATSIDNLPLLFKILKNNDYSKRLRDDPRYTALINKIENDIAEN